VTLADTEADLEEHGRIGYGRYGSVSPKILGAIIILVVAAIGIGSLRERLGDDPSMAPDIELTLVDGSRWRLSDHRGAVVVVNFWASWCVPCKEEMPAFEQASAQGGADLVFVGVGAKLDRDEDVRAFVQRYGVTYAIGRDLGGDDRGRGTIERDYGVVGYPATFFVSPDGTISAVVMGAIDIDRLQIYIDDART
jgi:thiol-disulfide isomerase/thioredoxin